MSADSTVAEAEARVGQTLRQKWRLDELLGVGGMAAVYAATHRNGSRGAIKILHPALSAQAPLRERFLREGYVANAVEHPGAVRAIDDDVDGTTVFLVLELLTGETAEARQLRLGGRLPADQALDVADGVLSVLEAAHAKGIVHRDVKPENVFLCTDGAVKLLDFGIARLRDGAAKHTHSGAAFGTPAFMAPEQALGHVDRVGPRTDLWCTGATLYTLLTGQLVHPGSTANETFIAAGTRQAASLADLLPDAHPTLVALVDRALAFEPAARWASATEMREVGRAVRRSLESPQTLRDRPSRPDPDDTRVRIGLVSAAGEQVRGPLELGLEGALKEPCSVRLWPSYGSLVDALGEGQVDVAWLPPVAYLRARARGSAKLLAMVQRGSRTGYGCVLLGRAGDVPSLAFAKGKRAAWVDAWSAAGYLVPRSLLRDAGHDPDVLFSSETFYGDYASVLAALRAGQADLGGCYARLDESGRVVSGPWLDEPGLTVLATRGPIPADTLCTPGSLDAGRFEQLQRTLTKRPFPPALLVALQASSLSAPDPGVYDAFERAYLAR